MRIFIDLNHPKDINVFRNVINKLSLDGHFIKIVASDKENILEILDSYGLEYEIKPHYNGLLNKVIGMIKNDYRLYKIARNFNADIFTSFGSPYAAQVSKMLGRKHISFTDTDSDKATINQFVLTTLLFSEVDYVPACHRIDRGKKQKKFNGYYELSYLHPRYFSPNPSILSTIGLSEGDKYSILRLSALNAHHDIGAKGFEFTNDEELISFIDKLSIYGKVFLTTEVSLGDELQKYKANIPPTEFHNFLFYSSLYMGEGASIAAEAAILGVPSIYVSNTTRGYLEELENKYGLCFSIQNKHIALEKAIKILEADTKQIWAEKRARMLMEKVNVVDFMVNAIEKELRLTS